MKMSHRSAPLKSVVNNYPLRSCFIICVIFIYQLSLSLGYQDWSSRHYGERNKEDIQRQQHREVNYGTARRTYGHYGNSSEVAVDSVEIPYPVRVGQTVQLKCTWRVGTKEFYAMRWYKDGVQFYHLEKNEKPRLHKQDDINVNVVLSESDDQVVTLRDVTPKEEGEYMCEIMSEGPQFSLGRGQANLTVVELPETPQLIGLQHQYMAGDTLNVTCRAANGRPAPKLTFKVNDAIVHGKSGRTTELPISRGDRPDVVTSQTRLLLPLSTAHTPSFTLGCYADTHGLVVQKEVNIQVSQRSSLLTFFGRSSSGTISQPHQVLIFASICTLTSSLLFH